MRGLEIRREENTLEIGRVPSNNYLFVPGDIVAINPGTDDGVPSGDKWRLLQVNKPHESNRDRPAILDKNLETLWKILLPFAMLL